MAKSIDAPDTPEWHRARQLIVQMKNGINDVLSGYFGEEELDGEDFETVKESLLELYELFAKDYEYPKQSLGPLFPEN